MVRTLKIVASGTAVSELKLPAALPARSLTEVGTLSASGSLHLPLTFPGLELLQGLDVLTDPSIDLGFSAGSPIDVVPTFNNLPSGSDIANLANLSSLDFFSILTKILQALQDPTSTCCMKSCR